MLKTALLLLMVSPAMAADPDVCRPYATQMTNAAIKELWTRGYTYCLNLEEDSPVPPESWKQILETLNVGPLAPVYTKPPGSVPASDKVDPAPAPVSKNSSYIADCRRNFRSFRDSDQTVIPYYAPKTRIRCPCPDHCDK